MAEAESYQPQSSRLARLARAQQSMIPGTIEGRLRQASPVPKREYIEPGGLSNLFVGPTDPGLDAGYDFWFDTDEPVV